MIAEEAMEKHQTVAAQGIAIFHPVTFKLDHQGVDVGDIAFDGEESRRQAFTRMCSSSSSPARTMQ